MFILSQNLIFFFSKKTFSLKLIHFSNSKYILSTIRMWSFTTDLNKFMLFSELIECKLTTENVNT